MYVYGATPAFPTSSWNATNYWVDVLFAPASAERTPGSDSARWPPPGGAALAGCGGDEPAAAARNPRPARAGRAARAGRQGAASPAAEASRDGDGRREQPGYKALVEQPARKPRERFTPVQPGHRSAGAGDHRRADRAPVEAPQGPTCIYRSRDGATTSSRSPSRQSNFGDDQAADGRIAREVEVVDRAAYCGTYGQPMLYVPLARRPRAQRRRAVRSGEGFAREAVPQPARRLRGAGAAMYQVSNSRQLLRAHRRLRKATDAPGRASTRTVVLLGLTSLFTDISSEMVVAVLPLYLVSVGGFSPLAFGLIDGLYNGAARSSARERLRR